MDDEATSSSGSSIVLTKVKNPSKQQQQHPTRSTAKPTAAAATADMPASSRATAMPTATPQTETKIVENVLEKGKEENIKIKPTFSTKRLAINAGHKRKRRKPLNRQPKRRQRYVNPATEQEILNFLKMHGMSEKPAHMFDDVDMSNLDLSLVDCSGTSADVNDDRSFLTISEMEVEHGGDIMVEDDDATAVDAPVIGKLDAVTVNPEPSNNNSNTKETVTNPAKKPKREKRKEENERAAREFNTFFTEQNATLDGAHQQQKQQQQWNSINSSKVPTLFLPRVEKIQPLLDRLNSINGVINGFYTKCTQNGAIRLQCSNLEVYQKISTELQNDNTEVHTHQLRKDRGYRIVIRHLHASTERNWIHEQLSGMGFMPRYIRVMSHRFSGKPMNLFEVELQPTIDGSNEKILTLKKIGDQNVTVEKQRKRIDPVQCHRCQAFGHSRNYCRRQFVCLKCAGYHATSECTKARNTPAKCANCSGAHVASYKGCRVFKEAQSKMAINKARKEVANIMQQQPQPQQQQSEKKPKHHQKQQQQKVKHNSQHQHQQVSETSQRPSQQQPNPNLTAKVEQNARLIALMGKKMDAIMKLFQTLLNNSNPSPKSSHKQQQQQHIEPIIYIAPPNPNDMSVESIPGTH